MDKIFQRVYKYINNGCKLYVNMAHSHDKGWNIVFHTNKDIIIDQIPVNIENKNVDELLYEVYTTLVSIQNHG
jgi:hypothetical protein